MDDIWEAALATDVSFYNTKTIQDVHSRLRDEVEELINCTDSINQLEEFGDVLFLLTSYSRLAGIDPSAALSSTIIKIRDRHKEKVKR
jgi:NTP pyrophosphatase (non-canonical NTP hydrolase)